MSISGSRRSRARLQFETLEIRANPSGDVTAAISGGILKLEGDDFNNVASIEITATDVIITPDATTSINGNLPGDPEIIAGVPTGIQAKLYNGDDELSIDGTADFILPKGAKIDLGSGDNTLTLVSTGTIDLASLSVKASDGTDTVTLDAQGATRASVTGKTTFDFGVGRYDLSLDEVDFSGPTMGIKSKGGSPLLGGNDLNADMVTIDKGIKYSGNGLFTSEFTDSVIGSIKSSGLASVVALTDTTVTGNVNLISKFQSALSSSGVVTIAGNVNLTAKNPYSVALLDENGAAADTLTVTGNVSMKSNLQSIVALQNAAVSFKNFSVKSNGISQLNIEGESLTVNGNLTVKGKALASLDFDTTAVSVIKGKTSVTGGFANNLFATTSMFQADKDISLKFSDNVGSIGNIGDGTNPVSIAGLKATFGDGDDSVELNNVVASGKINLKMGSGSDLLSIENSSIFNDRFMADMGNGDDTISIAQDAGAANPVSFVGKATIKAGNDNDLLLMGLDGGDAGQAVVFTATGSIVDGGSGVNEFDDLTFGVFNGITLGTGITNWMAP